MWIFAAIMTFFAFGMGGLMLIDIAFFIKYGIRYTLSYKIREYLDCTDRSIFWQALVFFVLGFAIGSALTHFTGWYI